MFACLVHVQGVEVWLISCVVGLLQVKLRRASGADNNEEIDERPHDTPRLERGEADASRGSQIQGERKKTLLQDHGKP